MQNQYKIVDNFLPYNDFFIIKDFMLNEYFPWYLNTGILARDESSGDNSMYQFTHIFYGMNVVLCNHIDKLDPLLSKINPSSLLRVKANLNPNSGKKIKHGFHLDLVDANGEAFEGYTALYYVNSNNGTTTLKCHDREVEIESVENRLLIFPSDIHHSGSTCTDQNYRCVINLNFTLWKNSPLRLR